MDSTTERTFLEKFLEYHREVTTRFDKLEELIKRIDTRQAIIESEGSKSAIKELTQMYYALEKRVVVIEQSIINTQAFQDDMRKGLDEIKKGMPSEEEMKLLRKVKPFIYIAFGLYVLLQVWDFIRPILKLP